jgi:hypothetical protein
VQRLHPVAPGGGGELEEDLLAGLEVAQQRRLVDADPGGDVVQADVAHAVAEREFAGGAEDGVLALLFLLGTPGPLEGRAGRHDVILHNATPLCC